MREMRALAVNQFEYILADRVDTLDLHAMIDDARDARFNALAVTVKGPGLLYYPSALGPAHPRAARFDLLGRALDLARRSALEVHAVLPLFLDGGWTGRAWRFDPLGGYFACRPECRSVVPVESAARIEPYPCPSSEAYADYLEGIVREIASHYDIDGLIMDFARYRGRCVCPNCVELFGPLVSPEPASAEAEARCRRIDRIVRRAAGAARSEGPGIVVGAYVPADEVVARDMAFEDWPGYADALDFISPTYQENVPPDDLARAVARHKEMLTVPVVPALFTSTGIHKNWGSIEAIRRYVKSGRTGGAAGFVLRQYETLFSKEPCPYSGAYWGSPQPRGAAKHLTKTVFANPAEPLFSAPASRTPRASRRIHARAAP